MKGKKGFGRKAVPAEQRFLSKIAVRVDGCHEWADGKDHDGYGRLGNVNGRGIRAHRYSYERSKGPIPEGMVIDHLCRNRACVNPDHLRVVTNRQNVLIGDGPPAQNARKTHCLRGHPLTGNNLVCDPKCRRCLICHRAHTAAYRARKRLRDGITLGRARP